jgi:hypothetical protein
MSDQGGVDLVLPQTHSLSSQFDRDAYVICQDVLPPNRASEWRDKALQIARLHARRIERQSALHLLRYRVVTGDVILAEWPELFATYHSSELRDWVARIVGVPTMFPSSHLRSAININVMGEPGEIYRWHTDASGHTVLLYLSDSREDDGGSLEIRAPGAAATIRMAPAAGALVLMDGTRCVHRVSPILRHHERISIPMVFSAAAEQQRPADLDEYLYV